MRISLIGPGRAGTALVLASHAAGHDVVAVAARRPEAGAAVAERVGAVALVIGDEVPPSDLVIVAVRDDAIAEVAAVIAPALSRCDAAVHLSGLAPVARLEPLGAAGLETGSLHPLQTLPSPEAGAARLRGAWAGVTAEAPLLGKLQVFAESLGMRPFTIEDDAKALYHAAAAAAANVPVAAFDLAEALFAGAGVPLEAARPLVDAVVANAFELGPSASLTGPIARGDLGTVAAQAAAVRERVPADAAAFSAAMRLVALRAGRLEEVGPLLGPEEGTG